MYTSMQGCVIRSLGTFNTVRYALNTVRRIIRTRRMTHPCKYVNMCMRVNEHVRVCDRYLRARYGHMCMVLCVSVCMHSLLYSLCTSSLSVLFLSLYFFFLCTSPFSVLLLSLYFSFLCTSPFSVLLLLFCTPSVLLPFAPIAGRVVDEILWCHIPRRKIISLF